RRTWPTTRSAACSSPWRCSRRGKYRPVEGLLGGKPSPAAFVSATGRGDRPLEGGDGRASNRVLQARDGEAPAGVSEPTRTARDGRSFRDGEDVRRRERGLPADGTEDRIAVGRRELKGPASHPGRGVDRDQLDERELPELGSVPRGLHRR